MWHFSPELTQARLSELAEILIKQDRLLPSNKAAAIERCTTRLQSHFGIHLNPEP
jgi:hypothetical protein